MPQAPITKRAPLPSQSIIPDVVPSQSTSLELSPPVQEEPNLAMSSTPGKLPVKRGAKRTMEVVAEGAPKGLVQKQGKKVTKDKENGDQEGV
ncbi:hypothetical protein L7F22_057889 [Adiantum nelumboides]|nr:hypothetical protein [Adiantum nelumboides]